MTEAVEAPELIVDRWFNIDQPLTLAALRGRVVFLHAFQMLCPGCVSHCTPQAQKAHQVFQASGLQVIGLHTVFEHHAAMTPVSLEAFIHEYKLSFPVAVDRPGGPGPRPQTKRAYAFEGTP
ncbi:MAG: redoxin domain-containing protein, partial [Pseudolabrys sp.]